MTIILRIVVWIVLMLSCALSAQAQEVSRERELLKRAQSALQRSEQDKAKLQDEKAKLEQDKADLSGKLKSTERTKRELAAARKKEAEQQKTLDEVRQQFDASKAKVAQLEGQLKERIAALHESDEHGRQLAGHVKELDQKLAEQREIISRQTQIVQACDERNAKLVGVTDELLAKYHEKGFWDALAQREPFTGIKEVQIQNLLQGYREKVDTLKIVKPEVRQ